MRSDDFADSMRPDIHCSGYYGDMGEWIQTEDNECWEFGDEFGEENHFHRKWIAYLTEKQLRNFIENYLCEEPFAPSSCDTMGALTEFGLMPAYAIESVSEGWYDLSGDPVVYGSCFISEFVLGDFTSLSFPG